MEERDTFLNDIIGIPDGSGLESDIVVLLITLWCNGPALHIIEKDQGAIIIHILPTHVTSVLPWKQHFTLCVPTERVGKMHKLTNCRTTLHYVGDFTDMQHALIWIEN